ncbi:MAG: signal recognition particle-docking protein FtsY [Roseovarius confluentis]
MAFFSKLKERLFKSSSKIDEGLEAIVEDGGIEEEVAQDPPREVPPTPVLPPETTPEEEPAAPEETPSAPEETPEPLPEEVPGRPVEVPDEPVGEPELPDEVQPLPDEVPPLPEELDPMPDEVEPFPDEVPDFPDETSMVADVAPEAAPLEIPVAEEAAPAARPGFLGRLLGRGEAKTVVRRELDDDMLERIEELLITADMGVETAMRVTANMAEGRYGRKFSTEELKEIMSAEIARIMEPVARPMPLYAKRPQVVLVVGVNGSGKTTTIGKLASQFKAAGKSVVIAAGDTFRAAAVEQLQVWGDRAGVPVMTAPEGSDPASLAFDAMTRAEAEGADLLMIDTAGRLQNRQDLMEELAKIVRVIRKKDPDAPHNTLLVLDATTGQNALRQVEIFQQVADVSGLVMTKLDGTAKGGVLVALADRFGLPIHAIGVGEQIDDLAPFDPREFAAALTGLDA